MLTTYDRYLREYRLKLLQHKLERPVPQLTETEVIASVRIVQAMRQAVKETMRDMEGQ